MNIEVWAPHAGRVELVCWDRRVPMVRADDGWFAAPEALEPGIDYAFSLDGSEPLADPRSHWQPAGAEGPSRLVDHQAQRWGDRHWHGFQLAGSVIYELHVGTFTPAGTFDAAIGQLEYLVTLGVDAVEIMPVASWPGRWGWGYDGVALWAPHEHYGGPAGLKRFVDAAHQRGLGVVLDVVYNHLGPKGNHLSRFGPYFAGLHHTPWGAGLNLDGAGSTEVRRFVLDNARHWFTNYHIDGLRLDAVHALVDDSAVHVLEELSDEVDTLAAHVRRPLWLIAESDRNDPRTVTTREAGGHGLHAQWADDLHHAVHARLTGEQRGYYADFGSLATLAGALTQPFVRSGYSVAQRRHVGRPAPSHLPGHRFVVAAQNHDQVGNRANGERLAHLVAPSAARAAAALVLCSPYSVLLFQGEEWAASSPFQYFVDFDDPELTTAIRDGRRAEFGDFAWEDVPDPTDRGTFERSVLDWDEHDGPEHRAMLDWYRALLALRRGRPDLTDGRRRRAEARFDEAAGWLVLHRGETSVAVNLGGEGAEVPLGGLRRDEILLTDAPGKVVLVGGELHLPPGTTAVAGRRG